MPAPLQIGLLVFPKVTQLDLTGPLQVFSSVPGAQVHLIWKRIEPVPSDSVLMLTPTTTFADCPQLDVICVPGGAGTDDMINDAEMLDFLRRQAEGAKYITSVCTGSLVLGAAGLLQGLPRGDALDRDGFSGAVRSDADQDPRLCRPQPHHRRRRHRGHRFCADAGVDPGRPATAEAIQLRLEYNPAPPFNAGSPDTAPPEILARMKERNAPASSAAAKQTAAPPHGWCDAVHRRFSGTQ